MVVAAADERDEAEWVARELLRRHGDGVAWTECAVLYRTNAQSRALEDALRRSGVPYQIVGAISFYERREVKDLFGYLRLIANPADDEAFHRAIAVPRRGIGTSTLVLLGRPGAGVGTFRCSTLPGAAEAIQTLRPGQRTALVEFAATIDALRRAHRRSRRRWRCSRKSSATIDYETLLTAEGVEGVERWENVRELVAAAAEWSEVVTDDESGTTPLQRFLAEAALLVRGRHQRRHAGGRDADDAAHRQGTRVAGGDHGRTGGRAVPVGSRGGILRRVRRGTAALLRGDHPRARRGDPHLGAGAPPGRRTASGAAVAIPGRDSARKWSTSGARRSPSADSRSSARLGTRRSRRSWGRSRDRARRRARPGGPGPAIAEPEPGNFRSGRRDGRPGRAAVHQGRTGAPPAVRHRERSSGLSGDRQGPEGRGRVRRPRGRHQAAAGGGGGTGAGLGERVTIDDDVVRHIARLAELAVDEAEVARLSAQLESIVQFVAQLREVPLAGGDRRGRRRPAVGGAPAGSRRSRPRSGIRSRTPRRRSRTGSSWCRGSAAWRRRDRRRPGAAKLPNASTPRAGSTPRCTGRGNSCGRDAAALDSAPPGPAVGHGGGDQGQHRHHRWTDNLRLADPRGVRLAVPATVVRAHPRRRAD